MSVTSAVALGRSEQTTAGARSRAATRARLFASGKKLFAARGLHGVTTHDIAREAGVAAGTFYLHFKDKREIFHEIGLATVADLIRCLEDASAGSRTPRAGVRARVEALIRFAADNRDLIRILFSSDRGASDVESDLLDHLAAYVAEGRRRLIEHGDLPPLDPSVSAQALVGMLARTVLWWVEDPSRAPRDAVVETLTQIQLSGTHPVFRER